MVTTVITTPVETRYSKVLVVLGGRSAAAATNRRLVMVAHRQAIRNSIEEGGGHWVFDQTIGTICYLPFRIVRVAVFHDAAQACHKNDISGILVSNDPLGLGGKVGCIRPTVVGVVLGIGHWNDRKVGTWRGKLRDGTSIESNVQAATIRIGD